MNIQPNFIAPPEPGIHLDRMAKALGSMERSRERSKCNYIFEGLITKNLNSTFKNVETTLQQEIDEVSREFQSLMEKTALGEKIQAGSLLEVHALKKKVDKLQAKYFLDDEGALKHQIAFDQSRTDSIAYLSSWDDRGVWGWQKVDGTIQNLVKLMHQNPHLYHYGESCEGHINESTSYSPEATLSGGYISIGIDGTQESREIIAKIQLIADTSDYVKVEKIDIGEIEVYSIRVGTDQLSDSKQKTQTLEEHKQEYDKIWQTIEKVLAESAKGHESINWNNELSKQLHLGF